MRTPRTLQIACAPIAVALLVASCSQSDDSTNANAPAKSTTDSGEGKLVMWYVGDKADKDLESLAKEFEQQNPGVTVRITTVPWDAAHEKLITAIADGDTPDLSLVDSSWVTELAATNGLRATPASIRPWMFFPGSWDTTTYKNTSYGVPFIADTSVIYYRTDITAKAGIKGAPARDWAGYLKDLKAIQATAGKQNAKLRHATQLQTGRDSWLLWLPMVWQQGGNIYDATARKFTFDSPAVTKALEYYSAIFKGGLSPDDGTDSGQKFQNGLIGTVQQGASTGGNFHLNAPALDSKWQTMPLPKGEQAAGLATGSDLAVFKDARNPDAAGKFVRYLIDVDNITAYADASGNLPAVASAWYEAEQGDDPRLAPFHTQLQATGAPPAITTWQQIADLIDSELEKLADGKATITQTQQTLQAKATSIGPGL
ncbi:multiple sugar transport system substrate-binding protein [Streptomyces achromogenes]|uniref:extracellular solute-binding protein n=1 Tax=Streptomyces achromogenes TaxID=67255 RepID=UPI00278998B7|nr:extracellular solute-binding protein [Streptomyces achromogenes]MDQ0835997.1 multiple sugar transport system substrate-binding protein [Streptomyces achromogenes]